jgi:hypothetical protein
MTNGFDRAATEALALWQTETTVQPRIPQPRPLDVFDQMLQADPYPSRKQTWHPIVHQLIGMAVGVGLADLIMVWTQQ